MSPLPDYAAAREAARRTRRGDPVYPGRHFILGGEWVRQDRPGGPITVLSGAEAEAAMLVAPPRPHTQLGGSSS